jgi:hypothetical protein
VIGALAGALNERTPWLPAPFSDAASGPSGKRDIQTTIRAGIARVDANNSLRAPQYLIVHPEFPLRVKMEASAAATQVSFPVRKRTLVRSLVPSVRSNNTRSTCGSYRPQSNFLGQRCRRDRDASVPGPNKALRNRFGPISSCSKGATEMPSGRRARRRATLVLRRLNGSLRRSCS